MSSAVSIYLFIYLFIFLFIYYLFIFFFFHRGLLLRLPKQAIIVKLYIFEAIVIYRTIRQFGIFVFCL